MNTLEYIGDKIKSLRQSFDNGGGLSQEALADKVGVAKNTISRWETATYKPSIDDLEKLARFFGVSILVFFPKEETQQEEKTTALLRAAQDLPEEDLEELRKYAEYRKARSLFKQGTSKKVGRKRKTEK